MKQQKSRKGTRTIKKRTPAGRTATHYTKKKPQQASCARCGSKLKGIARDTPNKLGKKTKSTKRVSRKYGGVLCNKCVKDIEKYRTRMEDGYIVKRDLTIEKFLPEGWHKSLKKSKVESKAEEEKEEKPKKTASKKTKKKEPAKPKKPKE
jgi:large subunit ribosomal protein L34e